MQDSLLNMAQRCVKGYVSNFKKLVPSNVLIKSCTKVINEYEEEMDQAENEVENDLKNKLNYHNENLNNDA